MATGSAETWADFLLNEKPSVGGRGHRRPVLVVEADGTTRAFSSVTAAAEAAHVAQQTLSRRVNQGTPYRGGRAAL